MSAWHWVMLAALPLVLERHRARVWLALMGASVVANLLPVMAVPWYILIDTVAGAIVLRSPVGCAQRAIGLIFALMVIYSVGFLLANTQTGTLTYLDAQVIMGWTQAACLVVWGAHDVGKALLERSGFGRRLLARHAIH